MYRKNVAAKVPFLLTKAADNTALAGVTVTARRSLDGAASAVCAGTVSDLGNGLYVLNATNADMNGDVVGFLFTATNARPEAVSIRTNSTTSPVFADLRQVDGSPNGSATLNLAGITLDGTLELTGINVYNPNDVAVTIMTAAPNAAAVQILASSGECVMMSNRPVETGASDFTDRSAVVIKSGSDGEGSEPGVWILSDGPPVQLSPQGAAAALTLQNSPQAFLMPTLQAVASAAFLSKCDVASHTDATQIQEKLGTPLQASVSEDLAAVAAAAADKTGCKLAPDGLDAISTTPPSGVATTFREMVIQTWRRFFKRATLTSQQLRTFADDQVTPLTTQSVADDGSTQTQGPAI